MKVAILGANGKAGSAILKEAKKRGLEVTAIVRNKEKITDGTPVIEKDVYQLTTEDIKDFDVLVSALGFWGDVSEFTGSTQHLIDILTNQDTRLY
jgi:putative NADH-flavin reductase